MSTTSIPLLLCLVLLPVFATAAEVSLHEAIRSAVENRPQAAAWRAEAEAASASAEVAEGRMLPRIGIQENLLWTDEPASSLFISLNQEDLQLHSTADPYNHPPDRHDFETRLFLEQPLFAPELWYARLTALRSARAAEAGSRWIAEQSAFAAFLAYLRLQQSGAALRWAEGAREESVEIERLAREHYEAGTGLKADHLRARVALSEAERRLLAARNELLLARRSLAVAMGRPGAEPSIAAPVEADLLSGDPDGGIGRRADLEALEHAVAVREAEADQRRAAWWPRLDLKASYALHDEAPFGADAASWKIWSGLSWDIWNGGQRRHEVAAARAGKRAAEARLQEAADQAGYRLAEAELRTEEARLHLETARLAVEEAEESLELLRQRYKSGLSPLSDLLGVRAALDRARFDRLKAETALLGALGRRLLEEGVFLRSLLPEKETSR